MRVLLIIVFASACGAQGLTTVAAGVPAPSGAPPACTPVSGYSHCRLLTIDHTQVGGSTLTNYPVLVTLALGSGKIQNASCFDVVFTSDSGGTTKIPWETESGICNSSTGADAAWVLCASCSSSADTVLYTSYGNSGISTAQNTGSNGPTHVYDGNFGPVYHLGPSLSLADSTSGAVTATNTNATSTTGLINGGALFNGANAQIAGHQWTAYTAFTVSLWFNPTNNSTNFQYLFCASGSTTLILAYNYLLNGKLGAQIVAVGGSDNNLAAGGTATLSPGTWYYITATWDSSNLKLYVNGTLDSTLSGTSGAINVSSADLERIGGNNTAGQFSASTEDEYRFSSAVRATGWITADVNSQKSGANFVTVGSEV